MSTHGTSQENSAREEDEVKISWDMGTAYDFFFSLVVLYNPDEYGLRPSWAAGVRSRLPAPERGMLDDIQHFMWMPMHWVYGLPEPKDAPTALWELRKIPAGERQFALTNTLEGKSGIFDVLRRVAERRRWEQSDFDSILRDLGEHKKGHLQKSLANYLDWWTRPDEFGELILSTYQSYYQVFFAEEEKRIAPILKKGLVEAQEKAKELPLVELLLDLSRGVRFDPHSFDTGEIVLVPGYWNTPLVLYPPVSPERTLFLFGIRPEDDSLVPGEIVPEGLLRSLKALADPTRLRILRYLSEESLTPAQLSRRLRLRAPTVTHHLNALRMAGLVNLALDTDESERQYTTRPEALQVVCSNLQGFLQVKNESSDQSGPM